MAAPKKKSTKRPAKKTAAQHAHRSLVKSPQQQFFTFRITQQTVYWLILCGLVLALGIWVTSLSVRVQAIYDQIEIDRGASTTLTTPLHSKKQ